MITKNSAGLYPWSRDLDASTDVRLNEREGFAMLLGWLEKFVTGSGLSPGRVACERFWKEQVRAKPREKWQLDQWGAAMRWYVRSGVAYRLCRDKFRIVAAFSGQGRTRNVVLRRHVLSDS